jgi:hypothetical protein
LTVKTKEDSRVNKTILTGHVSVCIL